MLQNDFSFRHKWKGMTSTPTLMKRIIFKQTSFQCNTASRYAHHGPHSFNGTVEVSGQTDNPSPHITPNHSTTHLEFCIQCLRTVISLGWMECVQAKSPLEKGNVCVAVVGIVVAVVGMGV